MAESRLLEGAEADGGLCLFSIDGGETWRRHSCIGRRPGPMSMRQMRGALSRRYGRHARLRWVSWRDFDERFVEERRWEGGLHYVVLERP